AVATMKRLDFLCYCAMAGVLSAGVGCKSSSSLPATPSGLPEINLRAKTADEVKAVAGKFFLSRGYVEARSQHLYEMVYDKPTKSTQSGRALRIRLTLHKQTDDAWRLIGTPSGADRWRCNVYTATVL